MTGLGEAGLTHPKDALRFVDELIYHLHQSRAAEMQLHVLPAPVHDQHGREARPALYDLISCPHCARTILLELFSIDSIPIVYMSFFLMTATLKLTALLPLLRITISYRRRPLPQPPDVYSRVIVTTCPYTSALLTLELVSCLHP